jgi:hypothetical protein
MKKFFIVLFVLMILGGAGFFFGWAQFSVPPGAYGVMRSKTHGVDPVLIREGEFRWIWYKLIPTNVKTAVFSLNKVSRNITSSGILPSGGLSASLTDSQPDFSWEISGHFSFTIKSESLPSLVVSENIGSDADLRIYENNLADRIEAHILNFLVTSGGGDNVEALLVSGSLPALTESVNKAFPDIEGFTCLLRGARYPDYALYRSLRSLYGDYLTQLEDRFRTLLPGEAESRSQSRQRQDELAKYGELLTRYPLLLQYLALERGLNPPLPQTDSGRE